MRPEQELLEREILAALSGCDRVEVFIAPHLYDLSADGATFEFLRGVSGDLVVLSWLYPRSAFWVLDAQGVRGKLGRTSSLLESETEDAMAGSHVREGVPDRTLWCFDLRTHAEAGRYADEIARLAGAAPAVKTNGHPHQIAEATQSRWYPVVDLDRCNGCLECVNFCLFGVFGLDPVDLPQIEQPDACRPGCPACARICPQGAIMFPQHQDPAIAGAPGKSPSELKLDLSQLFRGLTPAEIAAMERAQAQKNQPDTSPDLDRLIDRLDDMDL